jgi:hypothetical protein
VKSFTAVLSIAAAAAVVAAQPRSPLPMDAIAERYVKLVLAVGQKDPDYVDAYYGPSDWKTQAESMRENVPVEGLEGMAVRILNDLPPVSEAERSDELVVLRHEYLKRQLEAVGARAHMLVAARLGAPTTRFDEESRALYDAVAPAHPDSYFDATLKELDHALPGEGAVADRYAAYRRRLIVPSDRLARVFDRAIEEARSRTRAHVALPEDEHFTVEYVTGKPWSGYNWYQGSFRSLIQVNTDLPVYIDRAIDLAAHEGYPGHHVYNALLEQRLVKQRGWIEFTVYPLFSPQSLIAEGTANYGIDVAFPGSERLAFERDVLFPLAGLDPAQAEPYAKVRALVDKLAYAGNEAARKYLNHEIDRAAAVSWLTRYAMMSPEAAEQRTRFFDTYRSYVINYNLGKDLVKAFVESRAGGSAAKRWDEFVRLLASPRLPSGLR